MQSLLGEGDALPRSVRYVGVPLAGFFLIVLFIHLGFPYEVLVAKALRSVDPAMADSKQGVAIHYSEVTSYLGLLGPGVQARDIVVSRRNAENIEIGRLILRPAWSTSWFRGQPSVYFDARTPTGRVRGAVAVGNPFGFDGSFEGFDLKALPTAIYLGGIDLGGLLDAEIDVQYDADGALQGRALFAAQQGSVDLPGMPVSIPYDSLDADLSFGGEGGEFLTIETAEMAGPILSVSASGHVARASDGPGELDLELKLALVDKSMESLLRNLGVQLSQDGETTARLGGTLTRPTLR